MPKMLLAPISGRAEAPTALPSMHGPQLDGKMLLGICLRALHGFSHAGSLGEVSLTHLNRMLVKMQDRQLDEPGSKHSTSDACCDGRGRSDDESSRTDSGTTSTV